MKIFYLLISIIMSLFTSDLSAQTLIREIVCSAGEHFIQGDYNLEYCIGEPVSGLMFSNVADKFITAGFIQPFPESEKTIEFNQGSIQLFPNPDQGSNINIVFNHVPEGKYKIEILNFLGQIFQTFDIYYIQGNFLYLPVDIRILKAGNYIIKINGKAFKSQKTFIKL